MRDRLHSSAVGAPSTSSLIWSKVNTFRISSFPYLKGIGSKVPTPAASADHTTHVAAMIPMRSGSLTHPSVYADASVQVNLHFDDHRVIDRAPQAKAKFRADLLHGAVVGLGDSNNAG